MNDGFMINQFITADNCAIHAHTTTSGYCSVPHAHNTTQRGSESGTGWLPGGFLVAAVPRVQGGCRVTVSNYGT